MKYRILALSLLSVALGACAPGRYYDYQAATPYLALNTQNSLAIGVLDHRQYVVSGDKGPHFVGLQRDPYGIPLSVVTKSQRPLADDIAFAVAQGLRARAVDAKTVPLHASMQRDVAVLAMVDVGADRSVLITLHEWKSDAFVNAALSYDIEAEILDAQGQVLARNRLVAHKDVGSGGGYGAADVAVLSVFRVTMQDLIGEPNMTAALQNFPNGHAATVSPAAATVAAKKRLTADEVKSLFVGNTETGTYVDRGREIAYSEYYRKDGRIKGIDAVYGTYEALYVIRADGCFYLDYPIDQHDGCYYFEHVAGNQYRSTYPDGSSRIVTILNGDPENLNR